jgi:hypothetical protein
MRNLTILLCDKFQKCWLCRHTFMANSPLVATGDRLAHPETRLYSVDGYGDKWWWIGKDLIGRGRGLFKIYRHLPGGTEENHQNLNQHSRSPEPRFEPETSRIRSSVSHSTMTFGNINTDGVAMVIYVAHIKSKKCTKKIVRIPPCEETTWKAYAWIKPALTEIDCEWWVGFRWVGVQWRALVVIVMNLRTPEAENFWIRVMAGRRLCITESVRLSDTNILM